jgi:hypothetical protein
MDPVILLNLARNSSTTFHGVSNVGRMVWWWMGGWCLVT